MSRSTSEPRLLDVADRDGVERYLIGRGLVAADGLPIAIASAGDGNMNLTLRVTPARGRPFIVKQGRPWVEKYPTIPAPFERTLVEAAFYEEVQGAPHVARFMPAVLDVDRTDHILVLEDVGDGGDFSSMYSGTPITPAALGSLLEWLKRLAEVKVPAERRAAFANRAMRELNHEHIFDFPLRPDNGLDLDGITPGLGAAAREMIDDRVYCQTVACAGRIYLAETDTDPLVHGDYFPGSWLHAGAGICVIDPEFCFLGCAEFDCGVLAAHLIMARTHAETVAQLVMAVEARGLNTDLVCGYAGVEIMRRLIGVAQLPISLDIEQKRALLQRSRRMVLSPHKGFAA